MKAEKILSTDVYNTLVRWVREHLGSVAGTRAYKWLILSHHKNLNHGEYPDWPAVTAYLLPDPKGTK